MTSARMGLGLAAVGRPAYITLGRADDLPADRSVEALERRTHELLDAAVGLGIGYFDVARSYGRAEQFLGSWLIGSPSTAYVASKWGYRYTAGWRPDAVEHEVKEHSLPMFAGQLAETTALLGPWLRLYQVHSLTVESRLFDDRALQEQLAETRETTGLELGFSTSGPAQAAAIHRAMDLNVNGAALFTSVQSTWNLLEPSAGAALADAHGSGLRVVIKEALANGRLTDRGVAPGNPLLDVARSVGVGVDVVALAAALAQPWVDVVLSGAVTVQQLTSNAGAVDLADDLELTGAGTPETPAAYWTARSSRSWQ